MEKELKNAFHRVKYEDNIHLADNIWLKIALRNKLIARIKIWVFSSIGLASLLGLIPAFKVLSNDLMESGFYEYLSLIFSNSNSIASYWRELSLSLAESLPTASIALSLSLILIFFLSLKFTTKQIIKGQTSLTGFSRLSF